MTTLVTLTLPIQPEEDDKENLRWDAHFSEWTNRSIKKSAPLCSHAVAKNSVVYGIGGEKNGKNWTTWQTSFTPYHVCRLASNHNGSVVVASTDGGTISLMRGSDGKIIATRRVSTAEGLQRPAEISFVTKHETSTFDSLIILVISDIEEDPATSIILVSAIDGDKLNSEHQGNVAEAARTMTIDAVRLEVSSDVTALHGCSLNASTIRFAAGTADGKVSIQDYNIDKKMHKVIKENIEMNSNEESYRYDTSFGIGIQHYEISNAFFLFYGRSSTKSEVVWYSVAHLNIVCTALIKSDLPIPPRVLAMEPIQSCNEDGALAVGVAFKSTNNGDDVVIQVVQAVIEDTLGLALLSRPHLLYTIPLGVGEHFRSIVISAMTGDAAGPYAFRVCVQTHDTDASYMEFSCVDAADGGLIGDIRLRLQSNAFDEAEKLLGLHEGPWDKYARFHPSEVALRKLERVLEIGALSDAGMSIASDCLQCLASGAFSGEDAAIDNMLEAANVLLGWPSKSSIPPKLSEFIAALRTMLSTLNSVPRIGSLEKIEQKKQVLESCLCAMNCMHDLLGFDESTIVKPFGNVRSLSDLFDNLIRQEAFDLAEKMWRSTHGKELTPEVMVASILKISSSVDPCKYAQILDVAVIPALSVNHEALSLISTWACHNADKYDDEDNAFGINASIFLLNTVMAATNRLCTQLYSSFSSFSPFTSEKTAESRTCCQTSPRSPSTDSSNTIARQLSTSSVRRERPMPTVLELGRLKGGAMVSVIPFLQSSRRNEDDDDEVDTTVAVKLLHAQQLNQARNLGLSGGEVCLRNYMQYGGPARLGTELVQLFSSRAECHEIRVSGLSQQVKAFCVDSDINYDDAILRYAFARCNSSTADESIITEVSSLSRCCESNASKCKVALSVLRAALLCGQPSACLPQLSKDAIGWTGGDNSLRSELVEASRLLQIDSIVRRYCGASAAHELFRVDNPQHARNLLGFICRHVDCKTILQDAMDLCEAFTHLSKYDASILILEHAVVSGNVTRCRTLTHEIFRFDSILATLACERALENACDSLDIFGVRVLSKFASLSKVAIESSIAICASAVTICEIALSREKSQVRKSILLRNQCRDWHGLFTRVSQLQKQYDIFVSPSSLQSSKSRYMIAEKNIKSLLKPMDRHDFSQSSLTGGKLMCSLLVGHDQRDASKLRLCIIGEVALKLVIKHDYDVAINFLREGCVLNDNDDSFSFRVLISVVVSLCEKFSAGMPNDDNDQRTVEPFMKAIVATAAILEEFAIVSCPEYMFDAVSSLAILTRTVTQILKRSDGGVGERLDVHEAVLCSAKCTMEDLRRSRPLAGVPKLHPSWYIGDGLLLPPGGVLAACVSYCKNEFESISSARNATGVRTASWSFVPEIHHLLSERGAHSSALGISSRLVVSAMCSIDDCGVSSLWQHMDSRKETMRLLAERSLGGSGNGITSVTIDSALAIPYIVALPIKLAFKIYKASLPTAITQRDFARVHTLAKVGIQGGNTGFVLAGWKNQTIFVQQCERLSSKAVWWGVLHKLEVDFDPRKFEDTDNKAESDSSLAESSYVASLMTGLVKNATLRLRNIDIARALAVNFAHSFGFCVHLAAQKHIEFLLLCPPNESQTNRNESMPHMQGDLREDLSLCERGATHSLKLIDSAMKRAAILRGCLVALEQSEHCDTDYERHFIVVSLYHAELAVVVTQDETMRSIHAAPFVEELEVIERRRDALSILMSFFHGKYVTCRPRYPQLFARLPVSFKTEQGGTTRERCNVLGSFDSSSTDLFDPLAPLSHFISQHPDNSTSTAIAPLCIPLGLPQGYIHVRGLLARFSEALSTKCTPPSLENDVFPVLNKLKSPKDQAILAEFCAIQYRDDDGQKLACLEQAIEIAIQSSNDIEARRRCYPSDDISLEEQKALSTVKRLTNLKSVLSDKCHVIEILRSNKIDTDQFRTVKIMIENLTCQLNEQFWSSSDTSPERFAELLLTESSLLAAEACMDETNSFSMGHFRYLASVVHKTCREISEKYSHIHSGKISKALWRRWLVHGDAHAPTPITAGSGISETWQGKGCSIFEDDDTANFVMDLKSITDDNSEWAPKSASQGLTQHVHQIKKGKTSSAQVEGGSNRDISERNAARVALRIAFVMSFAEDYHSTLLDNQENSEPSMNLSLSRPFSKNSRGGLLSRVAVHGSKQDSVVLDYAKELLSVVFASSGGTCRVASDLSPAFPQRSKGGLNDTKNAVTFAIRHRALRTVAILCPQEALEKIIREEGYLTSSTGVTCSLRDCCFGSFVAKEIEEMGLPLPHSDLAMLSAMDFHSFARTLWRHHRNDDSNGADGRLLFLLLEMSTRDQRTVDRDFIACIQDEMDRRRE